MTRIEEMLKAMEDSRAEVLPSQFWQDLNKRNVDQLERQGYENFKQTIATNYFTWLPSFRGDAQYWFFLRNLTPSMLVSAVWQAIRSPYHAFLPGRRSLSYNLVTNLLWAYVIAQPETNRLIGLLDEPLEGNPPRLYRYDKLVSQDLANSVLEYQSITEHESDHSIESIMELGAGYGRTAYAFLKLMPNIRYFIVDIPPALYVSERYLSSQFPDRQIFTFRPFTRYADVEAEMNDTDLVFLLPNQLDLLPQHIVSHFINISSLHEMRLEQIRYYFEQIHRLVRNRFYIKQWKVSNLPADNTVIREADYPIPQGWQQIYWRECAVQTYFFEALFKRAP